MFMRKYQRLAQHYKQHGVTFLEIFGDDSKETRVPRPPPPPAFMCIFAHADRISCVHVNVMGSLRKQC